MAGKISVKERREPPPILPQDKNNLREMHVNIIELMFLLDKSLFTGIL
jgi:hypothetical protein